MNKKADFAIGQVIQHRLFNYRGVIFDVDAEFQGSEEWYEKNAHTGTPPKNEPWYHVLIDEEGQVAYVAQRNLAADHSNTPIDHPLLTNFFASCDATGQYQARHALN